MPVMPILEFAMPEMENGTVDEGDVRTQRAIKWLSPGEIMIPLLLVHTVLARRIFKASVRGAQKRAVASAENAGIVKPVRCQNLSSGGPRTAVLGFDLLRRGNHAACRRDAGGDEERYGVPQLRLPSTSLA